MNCIYKISEINAGNENNQMCYIGYTKCLKSRMAVHSTKHKDDKYNNTTLYQYLREKGFNNFKFDVLVELPTYDRETLKRLEKHYYNIHKPKLNNQIPLRTKKEYINDIKPKLQQYRLKHREKNNEYCKKKNSQNKDVINYRAKLYYHKNKELINARNNSSFVCACGQEVKYSYRKKHIQHGAHRGWLKHQLKKTFEEKFSHLNFDSLSDE